MASILNDFSVITRLNPRKTELAGVPRMVDRNLGASFTHGDSS